MKKRLTVSLYVLAGVTLGIFLLGFSLHVRAGAVPVASQNGDVNGDGDIDISDAVYTLLYLFKGGNPPVELPPPPALLERVADLEQSLAATTAQLQECQGHLSICESKPRLPATGQTACYNAQGEVIDCSDAEFPGQDGLYRFGYQPGERFTDNADGTITDRCTGLTWQQESADVNGDGVFSRSGEQIDWADWQSALKYCDQLTFAGRSDWRLPNLLEALSLMEVGRVGAQLASPFVGAEHYWTSTTVLPDNQATLAFGVNYTPDIFWDLKTSGRHFVRAVRGP